MNCDDIKTIQECIWPSPTKIKCYKKIKLVHKIHQMRGGDTKIINIRPPHLQWDATKKTSC